MKRSSEPTKIEVATRVMRKLLRDRGEEYVRYQYSGSLSCAMGAYMDNEPYDAGDLSNATINQARKRVLEGVE
jgi:hypothetical protein